MLKHYQDYCWNGGKPCGIQEVLPKETSSSYKIVSDPYHKRYTIEKYSSTHFEKIIYDSTLLDFRHLTTQNQIAWEREILDEKSEQSTCLLRDQNGRAILLETMKYEHGLCRMCMINSVHGILLGHHRLFYSVLKDPFNGVILYDIEERPVMIKKYETDQNGEFSNLLLEEWNMLKFPPRLRVCLQNSKIPVS